MERRGKMARKSPKEKGPKAKRVRFQFHAPEAEMILLAGNFNDWDTTALPMKKDKEGNWKASLNLGPGRYEYRFFVDGTWQDDPNAQERVDNPFGGQNSVRVVG
jgi:1,4-alpha-glucan branching enzyme